jgi:peptidoglycan hydrolase-like protein with peptidoglycan-binding domain
MAGEPVLRAGDDGDWVRYLQQSLNHHYQQQVSAESGEFDAALDGAVRHFQAQQGIEPTGVVDALTWRALTGVTHHWPDEPVATAEVLAGDVGDVTVRLALTLTGEAVGGDVLADLTVDLATDPPAFTCTGATFLPGTAAHTDPATVEFTGSCALAGAADTTGYTLTVTVDPAMSAADWLAAQAGPLTVALPVVAGLEEVA